MYPYLLFSLLSYFIALTMVHEEETSVDLSQTEGYDDAVQPNPEYTAHIIESDGLLAEKLAEKLTDTRSSSISIFISSLLSIAGMNSYFIYFYILHNLQGKNS